MSLSDGRAKDPGLAGPLGSLALSGVRPRSATLALRAVRFHEGLTRLGVVVPFFLAHDVGLLFAAPEAELELGPRVPVAELRSPELARLLPVYQEVLKELAGGEIARRSAEMRLGDDVVTVVLARLLGAVASRIGVPPAYHGALPYDEGLFEGDDGELSALFASLPRAFEIAALAALEGARLFVLTLADAIDLDTLRLFGLLGDGATAGALAHVDLLTALSSPEANDIVNFSLEILPSVLETKTRAAAGTTAAHGYSGIGTRGSIDSLVLTELAWDETELARRIADNEVLFYAREQSRDEERRTHLLLVDASASMRGDRQTFARGMAIATAKKLLLEGEDVAFRFFDSRLYETQRTRAGKIPTGHVLSFKGERGRNPARVFSELAAELDVLHQRDAGTVLVHLFTHAALYIPRELVSAVAARAHLAAVFILPSGGKLDLDYLDLLEAHWVVDHATLAKSGARAAAARAILDQGKTVREGLAAEGPTSTRGPASGGPRSGPASVSPRSGPASVRPPPRRTP